MFHNFSQKTVPFVRQCRKKYGGTREDTNDHIITTRFACRKIKVGIRTYVHKFDIHGSVHRRLLSRNTNKMQFCNRIYYSNVYWRLNMFRAAHRSSSGALNCICSFWFICRCQGWVGNFPLSLGNGRSPHGHIIQRLQIQFRAPDDERCAARNMLSLQ